MTTDAKLHHHAGRRVLPTSDRARSIAHELRTLVSTATGNVSPEDGCFLLSLIESINPSRLLEIGVASGSSSVMILKLLEAIGSESGFVSVDLQERYYPDVRKPVGYLVDEHYPSRPPAWTLLTRHQASTFASDPAAQGLARGRAFDFVFIDAHHGHPWPTLDALCLLPYIIPDSWIAFHDINLPLLGDYPWFGPVYVIEDWPLDVVISDQVPIPNVGAIRLSDAGADDADRLIEILDRPWDCGIHRYHRDKILTHLKSSLTPRQLQTVVATFADNKNLEAR
jgi:predicted O-methyltransferase YrrM